MSAGTAVLASLESPQWNAQVYASMAKASEIFGIIKDRGQALRLAYALWRFNGELDKMLEKTYAMMEGKVPTPPATEPLTPGRARECEQTVRRLAILMITLYDEARRKRLTNYSILGGPLSRVRVSAEELLDLADWIDDFCDEANVEAVFARSHAEQERGEVFDLSQVE